MATLTVLSSSYRGANVNGSWSAASAGGDEFDNDGDTILVVQTTTGSATTLTFATPATPGGLTITPKTYSISNSGMHILGPFPREWFNNASGRVSVTYSSVTNLNVQPVKLSSV
jgi:hypothetical protein